MKNSLLEIIRGSLNKEASNLYEGKRGTCSIDGCPNDVYSNYMCNAHYLRSRKGVDMEKPVQSKRSAKCIECNSDIDKKGGWNRCSKHYKLARQMAIKKALVDAMGGECSNCKGKFPLEVYDFHHIENKELDPSYAIANRSIEFIANEISKCVLLCANCHRIEHAK